MQRKIILELETGTCQRIQFPENETNSDSCKYDKRQKMKQRKLNFIFTTAQHIVKKFFYKMFVLRVVLICIKSENNNFEYKKLFMNISLFVFYFLDKGDFVH